MEINFRKTEESRANKVFLEILFEGGDGDTDHPQKFQMRDMTYANCLEPENLAKIEAEVKNYEILGQILDEYQCQKSKGYDYAEKTYGKDMARLFENAPNDPQSDYSCKCYLSRITLVAYDETGAKYESILW
jgi:hypothetical protein